MPDLTVDILAPVDEIQALLDAIDPAQQPQFTQDATGLMLSFSSGIVVEVGLVQTETNFDVGAVTVTGPGNRTLISIADANLFVDLSDEDFDAIGYYDNVTIAFAEGDDAVLNITELLGIAEANEGLLSLFGGGEVPGALPANAPNLIIDLGDGADAIEFDFTRDAVSVDVSGDMITVSSPLGSSSFDGLDELKLDDGAILFDIEGEFADYTYSLYSAALTRTPAEAGLRFWNDVMNSGDYGTGSEAELRLAREFVEAPEFVERFDVSSDEAFINSLYTNVLERPPQQAGLEFWTNVFAQPDQGREDLLQFFALSDENQMRIADDISDGYWVV